MKTIKEQIKSLFNGVVSIEKYNDCYIVSTKNVFVTNSTLNRIKEELKCKDIRIGINNEQKLLTYELFIGKITDRIKTFSDAWEYCGKPEISLIQGNEKQIEYFIAVYQMSIICKALNEGWEPDWDNSDEPKYYPYFNMSPSGFAFSDTRRGYTVAGAGCGSNFRLKTSELAEYCGKQFIDTWKVIQEGF
jgi:hypothetical protein